MENKSIEKNLNEIEIYSVIAFENFNIVDNYVTLDRGLAIFKAYDMYYDGKDVMSHYDVFIDTWKGGVRIRTEYIDSSNDEKLVVGYENYNV